MDPGKGLERNSQPQAAWRPELDRAQQAESADLTHHFVLREARRKPFAQRFAGAGGALAEPLLLKHVESRQPGAHRETVFAVGRGMDDRALERTVHRLTNCI